MRGEATARNCSNFFRLFFLCTQWAEGSSSGNRRFAWILNFKSKPRREKFMVRASVSLQLHRRMRRGQERGKKRERKKGGRRERLRSREDERMAETTTRVLIPFLSLHLLPRVSMAFGKGNPESPRFSNPLELTCSVIVDTRIGS